MDLDNSNVDWPCTLTNELHMFVSYSTFAFLSFLSGAREVVVTDADAKWVQSR
jgi:hypothetical protein